MGIITSPCPTVHYVYRIVCFATFKVYVGQTKDIDLRQRMHWRSLEKNKHHSHKLQADYNLYGLSRFYFEILERDISIDDIDDRERYWIKNFDSYHNGYNHTLGGSKLRFKGIVDRPKRRYQSDWYDRSRYKIVAVNKHKPNTDELNEMAKSLGLMGEQNQQRIRMAIRWKYELEWVKNQMYNLPPP